MGIRNNKKRKLQRSLKKTTNVGGERAKYFNQGIQDRKCGADHRYGYFLSVESTSRQEANWRAYCAGFNGEKLNG